MKFLLILIVFNPMTHDNKTVFVKIFKTKDLCGETGKKMMDKALKKNSDVAYSCHNINTIFFAQGSNGYTKY